MGKFKNDIAAEIQMRCDLGDKFYQKIPDINKLEYKFYELREYVFSKLDLIGATLDGICDACNITESSFIKWQLDYLDIDLFSLTKLERYLGEKLIFVK